MMFSGLQLNDKRDLFKVRDAFYTLAGTTDLDSSVAKCELNLYLLKLISMEFSRVKTELYQI